MARIKDGTILAIVLLLISQPALASSIPGAAALSGPVTYCTALVGLLGLAVAGSHLGRDDADRGAQA